MENTWDNLEKRRISEVARDYRKRGYDVIVEPRKNDLPDFLEKFRPDMIARNDSETVVIEVKTHDSLSKSKYIDELAKILEDKPSWRFELIVTNPKGKDWLQANEYKLIDESEIVQRLEEATILLKQQHREAALLLAWSAVEATMRRIAQQEKVSFEKQQSAYIVKKLFSLGLLDKSQYSVIQGCVELRNAVVHGYGISRLEFDRVRKLIEVTKQILSPQYDLISTF